MINVLWLSIKFARGIAAKSSVLTADKAPPYRPIGVLIASQIKASVIVSTSLSARPLKVHDICSHHNESKYAPQSEV